MKPGGFYTWFFIVEVRNCDNGGINGELRGIIAKLRGINLNTRGISLINGGIIAKMRGITIFPPK